MRIHAEFVGGNIRVKETVGDTVYLENELRDTIPGKDWFYWAFCVEGAEGRTLTFVLGKTRLGYFGPAVSHDLREWHWLGASEQESFTYTFGKDESRVYFAHSMLYHPDRFLSFAERKGLAVKTLCQSRRGRTVPCVTLGEGDSLLLLTARHHCCESTGSYVLEGVLDALSDRPIEGLRVFCVPFVDYDGAVDGDQGKNRAPYDHNRDYAPDASPIYPETAAIRALAVEKTPRFAFDFHSPYHLGGRNDCVFIVRRGTVDAARLTRFGRLFEASLTDGAVPYRTANDIPPNTEWNSDASATCASFMSKREGCELTFTLENAYFGTPGNPVSGEGYVELGRCFVRALRRYLETDS